MSAIAAPETRRMCAEARQRAEYLADEADHAVRAMYAIVRRTALCDDDRRDPAERTAAAVVEAGR